MLTVIWMTVEVDRDKIGVKILHQPSPAKGVGAILLFGVNDTKWLPWLTEELSLHKICAL